MTFDTKSMIADTIQKNSSLLVQLLSDMSHHARCIYEHHGQHGSADGISELQRQLWQVESVINCLNRLQEAKENWLVDY